MTLPPRWQYTSPEQALADAINGTLARHVRAYLDALDEWMGVPRPALGRYLTEPDEERNAA
jgi:hypothetical protein